MLKGSATRRLLSAVQEIVTGVTTALILRRQPFGFLENH
jgi:hypothetical protein